LEEVTMTTKEKILTVINGLDDDASIDQAIYRLSLLRKIEIGQQQIAAGQFMEHDEFMDQLENEDVQGTLSGAFRPRRTSLRYGILSLTTRLIRRLRTFDG